MKILMVNTEYHRGGAARVARTLHDALNTTFGFQSRFAYGRGPKADSREAVRFTWQPEVYLHALLTQATGLQGYGSWLSTRRLVRLIHKTKPDIIHLHNLHGYYLNLSIVQSLGRSGIPVVWTLHDGWPITGRCAYLFECDRWKTGCGRCPNLSCYPRTYLDSSTLMWKRKKEYFARGWNPVVICPSRWLANRVRESHLGKHRIEVIPNGIDTQIFKPRDRVAIREQWGISSARKVILFVAADLEDERKGAKYSFEALRHIELEDWMVLTLGKKVNLPRETEAVADIKQLGYISDQEEVAQIYSAADVFCVTSLDDNFPTTVLESLACGTPVVGFEVGGIPEQVTEGCASLVPPRDAKALGEALTHVLRNDTLRKPMSANGRARAVENYTTDKFRDRYLELYRQVLESAQK